MTVAPTPLLRGHSLRRRHLGIVVAVVLVVAAVVLLVRHDARSSGESERPELQQTLDSLVTGPGRIAPGATAYVSGPRGTWLGAAGVASVQTDEPMRPDARMRLESVSKVWTATIVHQLVEEEVLTLDDRLERWLPGVLPYGDEVTVEQLLNHTSGVPDDNVFMPRFEHYLSLVKDPELRADLLELRRRYTADNTIEFSPLVWVRLAAQVPPLFTPGTKYQYSNTGFELLGMIASRATGETMPALHQERIFGPLGLEATAWDPQGPISGPHARGYYRMANGTLVDTTNEHGGKGAEGALVSNAEDTGRFFLALMAGDLVGQRELGRMLYQRLGIYAYKTDCGIAYGHGGGGGAYKTEALASPDASRVAVLLLNEQAGDRGARLSGSAVQQLYCAS